MPRQKKGKTHQQIVDGTTMEINLIVSKKYVIIINRNFLLSLNIINIIQVSHYNVSFTQPVTMYPMLWHNGLHRQGTM